MAYHNVDLAIVVLIMMILVILAVILAFVNIGYAIFNTKRMSGNIDQLETVSRTVLMIKILVIPFKTGSPGARHI